MGMGDFDFSGDNHGRDRETGAWGAWGGNHGQAMTDQGFDPPYDRSPIDTPPGWHGGRVEQTGGMVMNRAWYTHPGMGKVHEQRPGRQYEYEVRYGQDPGVALQKYKWVGGLFKDGKGAYEFDEIVATPNVPKNTDMAKAQAAKRLMERYHNLTR